MSNSNREEAFVGIGQLPAYIDAASPFSPDWISDIRRSGYQAFQRHRWPTRSDEEWSRTTLSTYDFDSYKYSAVVVDTNVPYFTKNGNVKGKGVIGGAVADDAIASGAVVGGETAESIMEQQSIQSNEKEYGAHIKFEDGRCASHFMSKDIGKQGVVCCPLTGYIADTPLSASQAKRVIDTLHAEAKASDDRMVSWHYSLITHGVICYIPAGISVDKPILIEFDEAGDGRVSAPHVIVILEREANAHVIVKVASRDEGELICLDGYSFHVDDAARLDFTMVNTLNLESSSFSYGSATVMRDAYFRHSVNMFGTMLAKQRCNVRLEGAGSDVELDGIYFADQDRHFDMRTVQRHLAPNALSRTCYRGVAKDEAHTVYQGLIEVASPAYGTDAYLTNNNLLLSDSCRSDSIPSLNIKTDDVRCSHGSTTGKIDPMHQFYLESRGYSAEEAESLLVQGFFAKLIERNPSSIHSQLRRLVSERLTNNSYQQ